MSTFGYVHGDAPPPNGIVASKKDQILDILQRHRGHWVNLYEECTAKGITRNQVTARISDLRFELLEDKLGIYSETEDHRRGAWLYKLDETTPEYIQMYIERRELRVCVMTRGELLAFYEEIGMGTDDLERLRSATHNTYLQLAKIMEREILNNQRLDEAAVVAWCELMED